MPTNFRRTIRFRPKQESRLDEFNFVGGLVTDVHETKLRPNQSPDMANVLFNETGSIKTRNGYLRYNGDPIGVSSDQSNTGTATGSIALDAPGDYVAQTFQASGEIECVQVDVYMAMENSGEEQYVRAELWSTSDGAPDELLDDYKGQIKLVSGTNETAYNFRFRQPASVAASTTYALVIRPFIRGSIQAVNQVNVYHTGADYADGSVYTSTDRGLNWTADTGKDLKFVVYSGGDTGGTGLIRFYGPPGVAQLITKIGTTLYRGDDSTGAMTSMPLGNGGSLAAANFIDWTVANGTLLLVDKNGFIQKYRGSTNSNYTTGTISVTNGDATVTGSGTAWNTSTNAEVGEYINLPDGKWYKIISIASDTSLEIEVDYQGPTASGQDYTISPWGEVQGKLNSSTAPSGLTRPTPNYIENHVNRIWTLTGNTLNFSVLDTSVEEEHFNDWDTANNAGSIIIPAGSGDTGTGLYSLGNALFVFQRRSIWAVYGNSPSNFELRNISKEVGLIDKRTLVERNGILTFLSDDGVIMFDGSNTQNITDGVINSEIAAWANKTSPVATLWDNKYVIAYTPSGGAYNSEALFYDYTRGVWGKLEGVYASAWSNWKGGTDTGQVYFVSSNQGSIYRWDTGRHDDGYEIRTRYHTASISFGSQTNEKSIKRFYLQQLALGDWNMTVDTHLDISSEHDTTVQINLAPGDAAFWDVFQWDVDSWSNESNLLTTRVSEFQGVAKYYAFEFIQEGYDEGVEIFGITATARVRRLT